MSNPAQDPHTSDPGEQSSTTVVALEPHQRAAAEFAPRASNLALGTVAAADLTIAQERLARWYGGRAAFAQPGQEKRWKVRPGEVFLMTGSGRSREDQKSTTAQAADALGWNPRTVANVRCQLKAAGVIQVRRCDRTRHAIVFQLSGELPAANWKPPVVKTGVKTGVNTGVNTVRVPRTVPRTVPQAVPGEATTTNTAGTPSSTSTSTTTTLHTCPDCGETWPARYGTKCFNCPKAKRSRTAVARPVEDDPINAIPPAPLEQIDVASVAQAGLGLEGDAIEEGRHRREVALRKRITTLNALVNGSTRHRAVYAAELARCEAEYDKIRNPPVCTTGGRREVVILSERAADRWGMNPPHGLNVADRRMPARPDAPAGEVDRARAPGDLARSRPHPRRPFGPRTARIACTRFWPARTQWPDQARRIATSARRASRRNRKPAHKIRRGRRRLRRPRRFTRQHPRQLDAATVARPAPHDPRGRAPRLHRASAAVAERTPPAPDAADSLEAGSPRRRLDVRPGDHDGRSRNTASTPAVPSRATCAASARNASRSRSSDASQSSRMPAGRYSSIASRRRPRRMPAGIASASTVAARPAGGARPPCVVS